MFALRFSFTFSILHVSATEHLNATFAMAAIEAPKPSCAPHLLQVRVGVGDLLMWNGAAEPNEPILLRELKSDSERLMVLSEIGIPSKRRHPEQIQQNWINVGKLFGSGHRSKRQTFLSKIFGRSGTKSRFDEYLLTGQLRSVGQHFSPVMQSMATSALLVL